MERFSIRNIGPIKQAEFELNKVNVLIGPQSSGKSTIAKIVSFCQWLEKHVIINQGIETINTDFFRNQLLSFHGFNKFFKENSYIGYESDIMSFKYHSIQSYEITIKEGFKSGVMNKVAYIPSERNILSLPNISTLQMENNYIRSFMFDWLAMRNKYDYEHRYSILNLGIKYYYDESRGDVISLDEGKELSLSEASSGLQALIPMLVYVNYVTKWIYENDADLSYDKYTSLQKALLKEVLNGQNINFTIDEALQSPRIKESISSLLKTMSHFSRKRDEKVNSVSDLIERIGRPHSSKITIEEGEMNIFPSTQYELVKTIVGAMNFNRGDTLLLTTHSPYIITSINNLIQAGNAAKAGEHTEQEITSIVPTESWLNYNDVSAWAVDEGTIASICDDEYQLISAEALDKASDEIASDYTKLL